MNFEFAEQIRNKKYFDKIEILKQVSNVASCKNIQTSGPGPCLDFGFQ